MLIMTMTMKILPRDLIDFVLILILVGFSLAIYNNYVGIEAWNFVIAVLALYAIKKVVCSSNRMYARP